MIGLFDFLSQFFQPYFFYSLVFSSIAFICIAIFLKFNRSMRRLYQSIAWFVPLLFPVFVLLSFHPQVFTSETSFATPSPSLPSVASSTEVFWRVSAIIPSVLSITGLLCLGGISVAVGYLAVTIILGRKIVMRHLDVCLMAPEDYVSLQQEVKKTARELHISEPKVGLVDDLMPNAFTLGYGRNVVIVFSLGLLNMLDSDELAAVVSHELAHVKSRDYLFRSLSNSLAILSFFNPLSYFAAAQAQKERELLADEKAVTLLKQPKLMANVLAKVEKALQEYPRVRLTEKLSASLFLVSPLAIRSKNRIFASHPQVSLRIHNIDKITSKSAKKLRPSATALLLAILVSTALIAGYATVQIQKTYSTKEDLIYRNNALINNQSAIAIFIPQNNAHCSANKVYPAFHLLTNLETLRQVNKQSVQEKIARGIQHQTNTHSESKGLQELKSVAKSRR